MCACSRCRWQLSYMSVSVGVKPHVNASLSLFPLLALNCPTKCLHWDKTHSEWSCHSCVSWNARRTSLLYLCFAERMFSCGEVLCGTRLWQTSEIWLPTSYIRKTELDCIFKSALLSNINTNQMRTNVGHTIVMLPWNSLVLMPHCLCVSLTGQCSMTSECHRVFDDI